MEQRAKEAVACERFRTVYSIERRCGFWAWPAHAGPGLTRILQVVNATKRMLVSIEATGMERDENQVA